MSHVHLYTVFQKLPEFNQLNPEQKEFAKAFFMGRNLLLTGEAGTGKSHVIKLLFDLCVKNGVAVGKTALTGVAAFNIGGQTIHSFAGLGLADEDVQSIIGEVRKKKKALDRIKACKILIIDEASMMKAELLDKLDIVMKYFRYNSRPFGGCQIVFIADFLQLPPVWRGDEKKDFCFNARSWREANVAAVVLTEQMRQSDDTPFAKSLNKIRVGDVSGLDLIKTRIGAVFPDKSIEPVRIFCKNVDVNELNAQKLTALTGVSKVYEAKDDGQDYHIEAFNKNCPAPQRLELKVGAQVMLLKNIDTSDLGLVNGSVGVVESFTTQGPVVKFQHAKLIVSEDKWEIKEQEARIDGGFRYKVVATRIQIPLRLCWAVTVHKAQGMTLDRAIVDMNEAFSEGQCYVALSRVRNLQSLSVVDFPSNRIRVNEECLQFYKKLKIEKQADNLL